MLFFVFPCVSSSLCIFSYNNTGVFVRSPEALLLFTENKNKRNEDKKLNKRNKSADLRNAENLLTQNNENNINSNNNFLFNVDSSGGSGSKSRLINHAGASLKRLSLSVRIISKEVDDIHDQSSPTILSNHNSYKSIKYGLNNDGNNNNNNNNNGIVGYDDIINNTNNTIGNNVNNTVINNRSNNRKSVSNNDINIRRNSLEIERTTKPRRKSIGSSGGKIFGGVVGIEDTYVENHIDECNKST